MDKLNNYALEDIDDVDSENATSDFDEAVEQAIRDDEIDALLESAFADLDDDIMEPATESLFSSVSEISVSKMIANGMNKKDAIKAFKDMVEYLDQHKLLKTPASSFTFDENSTLTNKDLNAEGIMFIKTQTKQIQKALSDPKNRDLLEKSLRQFAGTSYETGKVVNGMISLVTKFSTVVGCIALPLFALSGKAQLIKMVALILGMNATALASKAVVSKNALKNKYNLDDNAIEGVSLEDDTDFDDDELDSATESSMFLDIIMESCDSMEEFQDLVNESAYEWEMYGLIDDAKSALEATKIMKVENWKEKNRKRLINRECIRVSMKKDDPLYKKYKKFRDAMREFREKIFTKYEAIATRNVRQAQQNSKHKAANMHTAGGRDVSARINKAMARSESGHNPTNAPKKSNAS